MPRSSPKPRASAKLSARGGKGAGKGGGGGRLQTLALFVTLLAVGALLASLGYGIWQHFHPPAAAPVSAGAAHRSASPRAPTGRVRVQVLNATRTHGLARTATDVLRDHGFDVVEVANAPRGFNSASSLVLDRVGNLETARYVADALGIARVETKLDTTLIVEATVMLGNDWKAPADQQ